MIRYLRRRWEGRRRLDQKKGRPWNGLTFEAARDRWLLKLVETNRTMPGQPPGVLVQFDELQRTHVWSIIGARHIEETTGELIQEVQVYQLERCSGDIWTVHGVHYLGNIYGERSA